MITKQELLEIITQNISLEPYPKPITQLLQLIDQFPDGPLNSVDWEAVNALVATVPVVPGTEAHAVFIMIAQQLGKPKNFPLAPVSYIDEVLQVFCKEFYFVNKADQFIRVFNEISQRNLISPQARQPILVLFLAISAFAAYNTDLRYLLTIRVMRSIFEILLPRYSRTSLGRICLPQSVPTAVTRYAHYLPSMQWFLGLSFQLGADFLSGEGLYCTMAYIFGSAFQAAATFAMEELVVMPNKLKEYTNNYYETKLLVRHGIEDISFLIGALVGSNLCSYWLSPKNSRQQEPKKDSQKTNQGKNNKQEKTKQSQQQDQRSHTHQEPPKAEPKHNKSQKTFTPIELSAEEKKILQQEVMCVPCIKPEIVNLEYKACEKKRVSCENRRKGYIASASEIFYKVLGLGQPKKGEITNSKNIKEVCRSWTQLFHPDKCQLEDKTVCQEQMGYVSTACRALLGK